jgi:hypothetical protein
MLRATRRKRLERLTEVSNSYLSEGPMHFTVRQKYSSFASLRITAITRIAYAVIARDFKISATASIAASISASVL